MLVLSRKEGQRIHIGPNVVVTVVRTANDRVRLGIDAPAESNIRRGELTPFESATSTTPIAAVVPPAVAVPQQVTAAPR